jgi:hypothetical protein
MATRLPKSRLSACLSITDDHSASSFNAGMNECLELGSGEGRANVRVWVVEAIGQGTPFTKLSYSRSSIPFEKEDCSV